MKNNKEQLREFFDGVEMSEEFRNKMKQMLAQPPKRSRPLAAWKPTLIAAAVAFVCLSGYVAARGNGWLLPSERPAPNEPIWSAAPTAHTDAPTERAEPTDPTARPTDPAGPGDPTPRPTAPTDPGRPDDPTEPAKADDPMPRPTEPLPTEPQPTEPLPTEPQPTEPLPTEPQPTEPQPTEPLPTEPQPTEPQPTDPQPTEPDPPDPPPEEPEQASEVSGFTFDTIGEEGEAERLGYLRAVCTKSDTNETVTVTDVENKRTAVVDVTGKLTDSSYRGWYKMFGRTVLIELHPDGDGGWYAFASEA